MRPETNALQRHQRARNQNSRRGYAGPPIPFIFILTEESLRAAQTRGGLTLIHVERSNASAIMYGDPHEKQASKRK